MKKEKSIQAEAEIKKIFLEWVGEDINDKCDYTNGYNYAKAEIKKKVEGEL